MKIYLKSRCWLLVLLLAGEWSTDGFGVEKNSWLKAKVHPVLPADAKYHSIHTYNLTCPESPDGKWLLFFRSTAEDAHVGDVCIVSRATGDVKTLATGVEVQDAHRVACQQWAGDGKYVILQDLREGKSVVVVVDVASKKMTVLGDELQIAFGPASAEQVALYGEHWAPARYGDLSLVDIATAKTEPLISAESIRPAYSKTGYAAYLDKKFNGRQVTLFFPNISPDQRRVYFKLSSPNGGSYRERGGSGGGSDRAGIFVYDLIEKKYLFIHSKWGHPAWHPDSRHIVNMWSNGAVLIDIESGMVEKQLAQPEYLRAGGHPSVAPDGKLFATDGILPGEGTGRSHWAVVVGDFENQRWTKLSQFDNSKGAKSWRVSHPHPVFSRDGKRIYFNVSAEKWTRLFVAELVE